MEITAGLYEAQLVSWNDSSRYQLDPMVRWLIAASLRLNELEQYKKYNRTALSICRHMMHSTRSVNRGTWLIEYLFHFVTDLKLEGLDKEENLISLTQQEIREQLKDEDLSVRERRIVLDQLLQYLEHDPEIGQLVDNNYDDLIEFVAEMAAQIDQL